MDKLVLSTKTKFIKNDTIKTMEFVLIFPTKYDKKDVFSLRILKMFLSNYSKKYPTEKEFRKELSRHMIINLSMSTKSIGDNLFVRFDLTLPMDNIIEGYDIEESFKFFVETIYNPLEESGHLDDKHFEREIEFIRTRLEDSNRSIYGASFDRLVELIDRDEVIFTHHDTSLKYLNNTTSSSTYNLYKDVVLNGKFISYVYGNFDEEKVNKLIKKYLPHEDEELVIDKNYHTLYDGGVKEYYEETSKFNQTALYMVYSVRNMDESDREYFSLLGNVLGQNENDLIFNNLRIKNNLVYSSSVTKYVYSGILIIETYLQYKNVKKAIKLIKETIDSLRDKDYLQSCIDRLLRGIEIDLLRASDSKYFRIENEIDEDLDYRPLKELYDKYKAMNIDDVIKFIDRIEENATFVMRGEKDEEE